MRGVGRRLCAAPLLARSRTYLMVLRPRSVKTLKSLIREMPTGNVLLTMLDISQQRNHRAEAVTLAALLESTIESAMLRRFVPLSRTDRKDLFEGVAPLATFSAKIRLGYALNMYGRKTRADLDNIREIRNAFAHARTKINFRTREVDIVCQRITLAERALKPMYPNLNLKFGNNYFGSLLVLVGWFDNIGRLDDSETLSVYAEAIAE